MALLFHPNLRNLFIGRALLAGGLSSASSISVYSGAQPTADQISASWSTYTSGTSNFLGHFTGAVWTQPSNGILMQLSTIPAATIANNTGPASWCIIWGGNVLAATVASVVTPITPFIVAAASDSIGQGVVRFADVNFTAGLSKTILDGSFAAALI